MMKTRSAALFRAPSNKNLYSLVLVLQGALVGAGAILPGISGGVLCVAFGIYRPMMELLSHPLRSFKKHIRMMIPFLIGWILEFLLLARLVELLFSASSEIASMLFAGLILGTLPGLLTGESNEGRNDEGKSGKGWTAFVISFAAFFLLFRFLGGNSAAAAIEPNAFWYLFSGLVWGLSLVVPGLSSSSILIFLGLYEPMTSGIAALDLTVILPLLLGLLITALTSARLVNRLFERHAVLATKIIAGILAASTLMILPSAFSSLWTALISILAFSGGFLTARKMDLARSPAESDALENLQKGSVLE